jgi:SAM-dependent methyltransferase
MEPIEYERMDAAEGRMWWYRALHADVVDALQHAALPPGLPILDAGCGTGGLLAWLSQTEPKNGHALVGIDASPLAAGRASRKAGVPVALASADRLPFADASFAAVLSLDVLYHREVDPVAAVAEAHRCLAPGGLLVVNVPAYAWMASNHDRQVHGVRRFDRGSLAALLAARPFGRTEVRYRNTLPFPLMVIRRKLAPSAEGQSDVSQFPPLLERLFGGMMAAERAGRRAGLRYPFGGSVFALATK